MNIQTEIYEQPNHLNSRHQSCFDMCQIYPVRLDMSIVKASGSACIVNTVVNRSHTAGTT